MFDDDWADAVLGLVVIAVLICAMMLSGCARDSGVKRVVVAVPVTCDVDQIVQVCNTAEEVEEVQWEVLRETLRGCKKELRVVREHIADCVKAIKDRTDP